MGLLQAVNQQYYGLARLFSSSSGGLPEHNAGGWVLYYTLSDISHKRTLPGGSALVIHHCTRMLCSRETRLLVLRSLLCLSGSFVHR